MKQKVRRLKAALYLGLGLACLLGGPSGAQADDQRLPIVDAKGGISLPEDFRANLVHLGSWFVPEGEASGFHDVYADAAAVEGYRKTGKFPKGSVLVKELRAHKAGTYTTGANVAHATDALKQWFVMVKGEENQFPDHPGWGEGWGWALFKPDAPDKNLVTDYKVDCMGCHLPAKANDWVYIEGYPALTEPMTGMKKP